ncbi:MAG: hypothetical protein JO025_09220 [Verrucomicrobia bacterium]|nr:hypothetical protein [Verrucomicrobiota bacterium]
MAARHIRTTVSAAILSQHAELLTQSLDLHIPHGETGADRIRQHKNRLLCGSIKSLGQTATVTGGNS